MCSTLFHVSKLVCWDLVTLIGGDFSIHNSKDNSYTAGTSIASVSSKDLKANPSQRNFYSVLRAKNKRIGRPQCGPRSALQHQAFDFLFLPAEWPFHSENILWYLLHGTEKVEWPRSSLYLLSLALSRSYWRSGGCQTGWNMTWLINVIFLMLWMLSTRNGNLLTPLP